MLADAPEPMDELWDDDEEEEEEEEELEEPRPLPPPPFRRSRALVMNGTNISDSFSYAEEGYRKSWMVVVKVREGEGTKRKSRNILIDMLP